MYILRHAKTAVERLSEIFGAVPVAGPISDPTAELLENVNKL